MGSFVEPIAPTEPYCSLAQLTIPMRLHTKSGTYAMPRRRMPYSRRESSSWLFAAPHTMPALICGTDSSFNIPPKPHGLNMSHSSLRMELATGVSGVSTRKASRALSAPCTVSSLAILSSDTSLPMIFATPASRRYPTSALPTFPRPCHQIIMNKNQPSWCPPAPHLNRHSLSFKGGLGKSVERAVHGHFHAKSSPHRRVTTPS
mmetsp:Transcript_18003/g.30130  ORF Transcript_18003/g.30130 Transcript_18003/m.30130 type:complete len:204 (+) Transcript_18003:377-988(+)